MKEVVLSNEELDIIDRLQNSKFPSAGYDPYEVCFKELGWFRNQKRKKTTARGMYIIVTF